MLDKLRIDILDIYIENIDEPTVTYEKVIGFIKDNTYKYPINLAKENNMSAKSLYLCNRVLDFLGLLGMVELYVLYKRNFIDKNELTLYAMRIMDKENVGAVFKDMYKDKDVKFRDNLDVDLLDKVNQSIRNKDFLPIAQSVYCKAEDFPNHKIDIKLLTL